MSEATLFYLFLRNTHLRHMLIPLRAQKYVTSKHAVLGLTHAEAADYAPFGIRVNCVAPGLIETNFGGAIPKEVQDRELKPLIEKTPLGRTGKPREVANVVAFLCSRSASYVTGTSVAVSPKFPFVYLFMRFGYLLTLILSGRRWASRSQIARFAIGSYQMCGQ